MEGTRNLESGQNFDFGLINCLVRNAHENAITTRKVTIFPLPEPLIVGRENTVTFRVVCVYFVRLVQSKKTQLIYRYYLKSHSIF